jgi:hypothetical protein
LVYSANPALDEPNGLIYNFKQYDAVYGLTPVLGSGNGFLYSIAPVITVSLIGTVSKSYDGLTSATLAPGNYQTSGAIDGDTVDINNPVSGTYDTPDAGVNKNVAVSGIAITGSNNGAATVYGYQLASPNANGNIGIITPATLIVTADNESKTRGTTFTFTDTEFSTSGLQNGETIRSVTLTSPGTVATAVVGRYAITGSDAAGGTFNPNNYTITYDPGFLTVTPVPVAISTSLSSNLLAAIGFELAPNYECFKPIDGGACVGTVTTP